MYFLFDASILQDLQSMAFADLFAAMSRDYQVAWLYIMLHYHMTAFLAYGIPSIFFNNPNEIAAFQVTKVIKLLPHLCVSETILSFFSSFLGIHNNIKYFKQLLVDFLKEVAICDFIHRILQFLRMRILIECP
jgi:hypothetical protein